MGLEQPHHQDTVLGSHNPSPVTSASLGGIEGVWQRFTIGNVEQRVAALRQAIAYHAAGVDLLLAALQDPVLDVRATAYQLLKSVNTTPAKAVIAQGVLLHPGDRLYWVYKSAIHYNDEWFCLEHQFYDDFVYEMNWEELGYVDYDDFCRDTGAEYSGGEFEGYTRRF
jgi:hypothetical protein